METFQHNQVKLCLGAALSGIGRRENLGIYFMDGFRVVLAGSSRSLLPDGCFVTYQSLGFANQMGGVQFGDQGFGTRRQRSPRGYRRVTFVHGRRMAFTAIQGSPDIMVEVGSGSSIDADYFVKAREYARFGVPEYWLLWPDGSSFKFLIFVLDRKTGEYGRIIWRPDMWSHSPTLRRSFQLVCSPGVDWRLPLYELREKPSPGEARPA